LVPSGGGLANQILGPTKLYGLMDVLNKILPYQTPPAKQVTYISATPAPSYTSGLQYPDVNQYAVGPSVPYQPTPPPPPYTIFSGPAQLPSYSNQYTAVSNPYPAYPTGTYNSVVGNNAGYSGVVAGSYVTPNPLNPLNAYASPMPSIGFNPGPGVTLNYNGSQYYGGNNGYQLPPPNYANAANSGYQAPPPSSGLGYGNSGNVFAQPLSISPVFFVPVAPVPAYSSPTNTYNYVPGNGDTPPTLASYQPPIRPLPSAGQGNTYDNGSPATSSYPGSTLKSPAISGCSGTYNQADRYNNCKVGVSDSGGGSGTYQAPVESSYTPASNQLGPSDYSGPTNAPYGSNGVAYPAGIPPIPYPPAIPPPPSGTAFYPSPTRLPAGSNKPINQGDTYGYSGGGTYPLGSSNTDQYGGSDGGYPQQALGGTGPYVPSTIYTAGYQSEKQTAYGPDSTGFGKPSDGVISSGYGGSKYR
jgi:hypothetical protein